MPRNKLGKTISPFEITRTASSPATPGTAGTSASAKVDLDIGVKDFNVLSEPFSATLSVPAYDPTKANSLVGLSLVLLPFGKGAPIDADAWMDSEYPKVTALPAPAVAAAPAVPVGTVPSATTPTALPAVAGVPASAPAPAVAATPAAPAAPVVAPVAAPVVAAPSVTLPSTAGGDVILTIPNLPAGKYSAQVIEQYDN